MAPSTAMEACEAALVARAPVSVAIQLKAGARLLLQKPHRIQISLFGFVLGKLPHEVDDLLGYARRYPFGRHGNRTAVKQAVLALRFMRRHGIASVETLEAA